MFSNPRKFMQNGHWITWKILSSEKNYVEAKMQKEATGFCHEVNNLKTNIHQYLPSDALTKGKGQMISNPTGFIHHWYERYLNNPILCSGMNQIFWRKYTERPLNSVIKTAIQKKYTALFDIRFLCEIKWLNKNG